VPEHPFLTEREEKHLTLIVITSDRGLCGGFNSSLIREAESFMKSHADKKIRLIIIGRRAFDHFKRLNVEVAEQYIDLNGRLSAELAHDIGRRVSNNYLEGKTDSFYVLYANFRSALVQNPKIDKILPVSSARDPESSIEESSLDYLYEPTQELLLSRLLERYIDMIIFRAMLESIASEHGARMTAMDNATTNAVDMIDSLTLDMNRARQASITRELLEIVATGESLK